MPRRLIAACLALLASASVHAQSEEGSLVSAVSVAASTGAAVLAALPAGSELVIESVHAAGKASVVVARASADGATVSFEVASELAGELALATGKVLTVSANAAGWLIRSGGKAVAFVPNEIGRALVHHRRLAP